MKIPGFFILGLLFICGPSYGLAQPNPQPAKKQSLQDFAQNLPGKMHLGNYMGGKKVGWDSDEFRIITHQGKPAVTQVQESHFKALFAGQKTISTEKTETVYSLQGDGPILLIRLTQEENGFKKSKTLELDGTSYYLQTTFGSNTQRKVVPAPKETLRNQLDFALWLAADLKPGEEFSCFTTALDEDDFNVPTKFIFRNRVRHPNFGNTLLPSVEQITHGAVFKALLDNQGNLIEGRMGKLLELRREKQETAMLIPEPLVDLIDLTAVPLDRALGNARQITLLKLQVQADGDFEVPQSHRQSLKPLANQAYELVLKTDFLTQEAIPLLETEQKPYLSPSSSICCEDSKIKKLSKSLTKGSDSIMEKSQKISKWVFLNLDKTLAANSNNALEVLAKMKGDCTEHTLLFVTLARSLGIPAREVGGLAYMNTEKNPRMAWHAWAEFHDGRQWVTIDPTWDQLLVDATHWKFSEGQTDMKWLNILGGIQVKVLEFKTSEPQPKGKQE